MTSISTLPFIKQVTNCIPGLAALFHHRGCQVYLVGGIVRDALLGEEFTDKTDIDLTTDARPDDIHHILANWAETIWDQGQKFGTVAATYRNRNIEITTHRSDSYDPNSRKPQVQYTDNILEDLGRRDFTINAMAVDLNDGGLVDPFRGIDDLNKKILRTPLDANITFSDDPLRMLRAARFASRFDLTFDSQLSDAMHRQKKRLRIVSGERIHQEMQKLLELNDPWPGLQLLHRTQVSELITPGATLNDMRLSAALHTSSGYLSRLAVLLHGQRSTETVNDVLELWKMANQDRRLIRRSLTAVWNLPSVTSELAPLRKWMVGAGDYLNTAILIAEHVDPSADDLRHKVAQLQVAEPDLGCDVLTGDQIMAALEIVPGQAIGHAKKFLHEQRMITGPISQRDALRLLHKWFTTSISSTKDKSENVTPLPLDSVLETHARNSKRCAAQTLKGNQCRHKVKLGALRCPAGHRLK